VRFRNELALRTGLEAGRKRREAGGDALDILSDIINIRYGDTRRLANASPRLMELNAQVFTFCTDILAGGQLVGEVLANTYREDLARAGLGSGRHSFTFPLPDGLAAIPDAIEARRSLDGTPLEFALAEKPSRLRQRG
jgi:hypothetical protein